MKLWPVHVSSFHSERIGAMSDYEFITVHDSAVTNTNPDSMVTVTVDTSGPAICDNMSDAEFRKTVLTLRDDAVKVIELRIQ
jgi:peptidyl-Lys metalloendopeptidase